MVFRFAATGSADPVPPARQSTVRVAERPSPLCALVDHRVQSWVETLDAGDRPVDELPSRHGFLSPQGDPRRCGGRSTRQPRTPHTTPVPTNDYYTEVKDRHDGKLAAISMARKLARRCYHTLRAVDPAVVYAAP
jgi:hypothetical protein